MFISNCWSFFSRIKIPASTTSTAMFVALHVHSMSQRSRNLSNHLSRQKKNPWFSETSRCFFNFWTDLLFVCEGVSRIDLVSPRTSSKWNIICCHWPKGKKAANSALKASVFASCHLGNPMLTTSGFSMEFMVSC